jgi:hypothetical protein
MTIEGIVVGLLGIALGAAFCFAGFRWFLLLLPVWGLFVGFMTGASAVALLLGEGFLGTALGIGVGLVLAVVFALLSWFYWWGAVAVIAGTLGYALAHAVMEAIGFQADGFLAAIISIVVGIVIGFGALAVNAPKYVAIILTAIAGASWLVVGVALLPGWVGTDELASGPLVALYREGIVWIIAWGVVAAAGIIAQLQMTRRWEAEIEAVYARRRPGTA